MRQKFLWCNNKSSTKSIYDKWNHIRDHSLLHHSLFIRNSLVYVPIRKVLLDFLQHQVFLSLTVFTVTILVIALNIVNCIVNCIKYFQIHQLLLIISAITAVSAIAKFYLFLIYCISHLLESATPSFIVLLLGRLSYQLHISVLCISLVIVSVTLSSIYMR